MKYRGLRATLVTKAQGQIDLANRAFHRCQNPHYEHIMTYSVGLTHLFLHYNEQFESIPFCCTCEQK